MLLGWREWQVPGVLRVVLGAPEAAGRVQAPVHLHHVTGGGQGRGGGRGP